MKKISQSSLDTSLRPVSMRARGASSRPRASRSAQSHANWHRLKFFGSLALCLLVSLSVHLVWIKHVTAQEANAQQAQLQQAMILHRQNDAFALSLHAIAEQYPDVQIGVGVATDKTGPQVFGATDTYDAASTGKLITAAAYLHLVDERKLNLQESVDGQNIITWLRAMVIDSDDTAWSVLNSQLGHEYLDSYARSNNLRQYDADSNTLTPKDMTVLLQKLAGGGLLSESRRSLLMRLMQKANYRDYIVAVVPHGMDVYHKVGFTDGNLHDAAIITNNGHWLAVSIFTDGTAPYTSPERTAVMQAVAKAAISTYL